MASNHQLRARLNDGLSKRITELANDHDLPKTDAERLTIKAGLHALGYHTLQTTTQEPDEATDRLLYYVHRIGLILGFVGLITIGYGIFGPLIWRVTGFGLILTGFTLTTTKEALQYYNNTRTDSDDDSPDLDVMEVLHAR